MFHSLKKNIHKASPAARAHRNAELEDYRQRLTSIKSSLVYTSNQIDKANKTWNGICTQQRSFAERFYLSYPSEREETYNLAKEFNQGAQATYDYFIRSTAPDASYLKIQAEVKAYIAEIDAIEKQYSALNEVTSEAARYQAKADSIAAKGKDEARLQRNFEKLDRFKQEAVRLSAEILQAQKIAYAKHEVIFRASLTSYWISNSKHIEVMTKSLEKTAQFAKDAEEEMLELDVAQLHLFSASSRRLLTSSTGSRSSSASSSKNASLRAQIRAHEAPDSIPDSPQTPEDMKSKDAPVRNGSKNPSLHLGINEHDVPENTPDSPRPHAKVPSKNKDLRSVSRDSSYNGRNTEDEDRGNMPGSPQTLKEINSGNETVPSTATMVSV